jgi:hypothetical protein
MIKAEQIPDEVVQVIRKACDSAAIRAMEK